MQKKWRQYEEKTFKIVKQLNPRASVYHNVKIMGKLSKTKRQVDVQLVDTNSYEFVAFECKDYKKPVDIPVIEEFATKLKDLGTKKGAVVSNSGFSKTAVTLAEALNIDLLGVVDTSDPIIKLQLSFDTLFKGIHIESVSASIDCSSDIPAYFTQEFSLIRLVNPEGGVLSAYELFAILWNDDNTPFSRIPNSYSYTYQNPCLVRLMDLKDQIVPLDRFAFNYKVAQDAFLGQVKVTNSSGIYDVRRKTYSTNSLTTEKIIASDIIEKWTHLDEKKIKEAEKSNLLIVEAVAELPEKYPSFGKK
jgi:hypothetical protein